MDHREARKLLPGLPKGTLDESVVRELAAHVERCSACRVWVATAGVVEEILAKESVPAGSHPAVGDLALACLRPEELYEEDRRELRLHLESCEGCRSDIERVRGAIAEARPAREEKPAALGRREVPVAWRSGLVAAGLAALLLLGIWVLAPMLETPEPAIPEVAVTPEIATDEAEEGIAPGDFTSERLADTEIEGQRVIESERDELAVSQVKVRDGARVTFKAGQVVAFGDGFQIGEGSSVVVEVRSGRRSGGASVH